MKNKINILLVFLLCAISVYYVCFSTDVIKKSVMENNNKFVLKFEDEEGFSADNFDKVENKIDKNYKSEVISLSKDSVKEVGGITFLDSNILLSDTKTDKIYLYDNNFKLLKSLGKTGNAKLEFINPTDIKCVDGYVYVLDYGNQRIQKLDKNLSHVKDIKFEKADESPDFMYISMAIDGEENIFLTGETKHTRYIQKINKYGKVSYIKDNFSGRIFNYKDSIYAVNWGQFLVNRKGEISCTTGRNFLLCVSGSKLKKMYEFDAPLTTEAFCMDENYIYIMSDTYREIMRFDRNTGKYIDSVGKYKEENIYLKGRMEVKEGVVYTSSGSNYITVYKNN